MESIIGTVFCINVILAGMWGFMKMLANIEYYKQVEYLGGDSLLFQWSFISIVTFFIMILFELTGYVIFLFFLNLGIG